MTKILVLGGGFSGVGVTQALEKLMNKHNDIELDIVSDNNYFMFQPMLPGVAAGTIEASHIVNPIRRLCKKSRFHRAGVDEIDVKGKRVKIVEKDITRQHWLSYDHLVISMGLSTDMTKVPGMSEHSLPMRTLGDAIFLRNEIINKLEMAAIEKRSEEKKKILTFVFVGGGFSGVETMGEVGDMIKHAVKHYPRIDKNDIKLILIHSRDRILLELGEKVAMFAQKKLTQRGLELRLNTRVKEVSSDQVVLSNGEVIPTKTVICTTGNAPHRVLTTLDFVNERGRLDTDEYFRVVQRDEEGNIKEIFNDMWALGDCAFTPNVREIENNPRALCPPTAQFAVRMAPVLAKNIMATINEKKLTVFSFKEMGQMAVIGHLCGVAEVMGIRFSGVLAFFMWRAIYWAKLPGIHCKFRVMLDWLLHSLFPVDITQLDVYRTEKVDRSHYQKGAYVFKQGDIADFFYVIEEGEVEVIKENQNNTNSLLAVLKAGDSFGEMGLMQKLTRSASVRCKTPVGLLKVSRNDFKALTGSYSSLKEQLEHKVQRIKELNIKTSDFINDLDDSPVEMSENEPKVESRVTQEAAEQDEPEQKKDESLGEPDVTQEAAEQDEPEQKKDESLDEPDVTQEAEQDEPEQKKDESLGEPDVTQEVEQDVPEQQSDGIFQIDDDQEPPKFNNEFDVQSNQTQDESLQAKATELKRRLYKEPTNIFYLKQYADIQREMGQLESSLKVYTQCLAIKEFDDFSMGRVGELYRRLKQFKKSIDILEKGAEINPNSIFILSNIGSAYLSMKNYDKTIYWVKRGLENSPQDVDMLVMLAAAYNKKRWAEKAENSIRKALMLDSDNVPALIIFVESLLMQNRNVDAEKYVEKARLHDDNNLYTPSLTRLEGVIQRRYQDRVIFDES